MPRKTPLWLDDQRQIALMKTPLISYYSPVTAHLMPKIKKDQTLLDQGEANFRDRPELKDNLGAIAFRKLSLHPFRTLVVDLSTGRRALKAGMLLAVAIVMSRQWKGRFAEERVGVVFPAGLGSFITNMALTFLGKVPVNLNFTAGRGALEASIRKAGIKTIITAKPVIDKLEDFPWTDSVVDLVEERKNVDKKQVLKWFAAVTLLPSRFLMKRLEIPQDGGEKEAGLLFSSGSTGEPKGIPLSHSNIIANCLQIHDCGLLNHRQTMMGCLPTFHSFGFTVTLWYPLFEGVKTVTLPSPLETKRIAEAIEKEEVTVMMGTPTFFRPYFRRATREQLSSLSIVVAGAEKTPPGFGERWEKHFGSTYLEGYGLTETSPVVSCNLPESVVDGKKLPDRRRAGSVGQLFPGMRARIAHPVSGEILPLLSRGVIHLSGPNVFTGYLDEPEENARVLDEKWFISGDVGRFDEDGYLYIEGRVSRFSKIGGEMVPHGTLEQKIMHAFHLEDSEEPLVAVTGIHDSSKGESLVVLSAVEISSQKLRERLLDEGVPNLWIPRKVKRVDAIPCLASGKLDLREVTRLAESANVEESDTEEDSQD